MQQLPKKNDRLAQAQSLGSEGRISLPDINARHHYGKRVDVADAAGHNHKGRLAGRRPAALTHRSGELPCAPACQPPARSVCGSAELAAGGRWPHAAHWAPGNRMVVRCG